MAVGVFGGTFDPVHLGHLILAETAADELELDRVIFMPAGNPYFKAGLPVSAAVHRMAMVEMAIGQNPRFEASKIEICHSGPSFTIESLDRLRAELLEDESLYLLLGVDSVSEMPRWKRPEGIFDRAQVVAFPRTDRLGANRHASLSVLGREVSVLDGPLVGISGTEVRERVSGGRSIQYLVPDPVIEYIHRHGLYSSRAPNPLC